MIQIFLFQIKILMLFSPREIKNCKKWMNGLKQTNFLSMQKNLFLPCHWSTQKDNLALAFSILGIEGVGLKRKASIKFLGVLVDENLAWKDHINTLENKISKNFGLIFRAKNLLNKDSLTKLYYSYIHCYLNYGKG